MSLAYAAVEPQPSLAWTFDSSNVDYVTNLSPSSQVSPGPAQLVGSASLVTNAPTSNTAVSFPGTAGNYMLINSTPATFDLATSNLFVECWVYFNSFSPQYQCIVANGPTGSGTNQECWIIRINPSTAVDFIINSSAVKTATSSALLTTGQWYHIAASYNSGSSIGYVFINGGTPNSVSLVTPKTSTGASLTLGAYPSPISAAYTMNGYIRDLRVVQGGIVPTGTFVPSAAPFTYALPSYVTGSGSVVFTLLGQFITYVPGKYNQAISFQGVQGVTPPTSNVVYTLSNPISVNNGCTLSFWVNVSTYLSSSGQGNFIYAITSAGNGIRLNYNWPGGGNPQQFLCQFYYGAGATYIAYSGVTINTWYHYTCVIQSNGLNLFYINGNLVGTDSAAVGSVINPTNITRIIVGSATGYNQFIGLIDDLRVYNTALSALQVQSIYSQGGAPASQFRVMSQPSLAWQFDSTTGPYIGSVSSTTQRGTLNYVPGKYISALNIQNPTGTTSNSINWNFGTQTYSIDAGFSFSCWVRFNDLSYLTVIQQFITFYNGTSNPLRIQISTGGLMQTQFTDSTANLKSVNMFTPVTGTWYHLTCVGSNGNITVYLNGTTTYGPLAYVQSGITFNNASLGLATSSAIFPVTNADFDDFRVFNTALTAAQVNAIYQAQGIPSRGDSNNKSFSLPIVSGYTYVPLYALPSSFTMVNTLTSNAWTYGGGLLTDGGTNPVLNLVATSPGDIYSATNPGIWYALNRLGSTTEYVRHQSFTMKLSAYTAANFDFAWAFFLKNGTTNQVIVYNTYNGGYWVQSNGINIHIGTQVQAEANVYTISSTVNNPPMKLTGTPLFSQLSASAIASSVGAFSLRAVNGTTARAVQVRPEGVFPPGGMTSAAVQSTNQWTQTLSGYPFGGTGSYVANCSSFSTDVNLSYPWKAFDNNASTWWENNYNGATGFYDGIGTGNSNTYSGSFTTTVSGSSIAGEWLQLQLPTAIVLTSYSMYARFAWTFRMPYQFVIAGSNDGTTWATVNSQTGINTWSAQTPITFTSTSTTSYSYFRLIVQAIVGNGTSKQDVNIGQWTLYGSNPTWNTDFYADRLGNLLTQPVIGQSLANWIGGATGYVTTWYDQSGRGNHATQSTAANQPVIQKATKGPGYSCLFSGSQRLALGSNAFINNTPYTLQIVERRNVNSNVAGAGYFGWGGSESTPTSNISHIGYRAWSLSYPLAETSLWTSQYADDKSYTNAVIKFNSPLTENVAYTWHTHDLNHTARIYTWRGGVLYPSFSTNIGTFLNYLRPTAINTYYIGWSLMAYYIGEIYEILIFTNSLYDLDNTGGLITQIYQNQLSYTGT